MHSAAIPGNVEAWYTYGITAKEVSEEDEVARYTDR